MTQLRTAQGLCVACGKLDCEHLATTEPADPFVSVPPERLALLRRSPPPRVESLLPPRALPGFFGVAAAGITGALAAAQQIGDPRWRAGAFLLATLLGWLVGYVTPPPRRHFRRDDP